MSTVPSSTAHSHAASQVVKKQTNHGHASRSTSHRSAHVSATGAAAAGAVAGAKAGTKNLKPTRPHANGDEIPPEVIENAKKRALNGKKKTAKNTATKPAKAKPVDTSKPIKDAEYRKLLSQAKMEKAKAIEAQNEVAREMQRKIQEAQQAAQRAAENPVGEFARRMVEAVKGILNSAPKSNNDPEHKLKVWLQP